MSRRVIRTGLVVAAPVLFVLLLKAFLFDVYRVDSGSMEPTIRAAGELVLVRYDRAPALERFDLVVILREGEREPALKRVVGLPGEELRLADGDLVVDGAKLAADVARPRPVSIFDSTRHDLSAHFECEPESSWPEIEDGVFLDESEQVQVSWRGGLHDDYVRPSGERVIGRNDVGDARISTRTRFREGLGTFFWRLSEEGDVFEAVLTPDENGSAHATISRAIRGREPTILDEATVSFEAHARHRVTFSNIDDHLAVDVDGRRVLLAEYGGNTPLGGVSDPRQRHRLPRAAFGAEGVTAFIGGVRLYRDLHYTDRGAFGTSESVRLGPGEIFVLGDNSAESLDGREWGPISVGEVIGVPLAVPWPLASARRLVPSSQPPAAQ